MNNIRPFDLNATAKTLTKISPKATHSSQSGQFLRTIRQIDLGQTSDSNRPSGKGFAKQNGMAEESDI